MYKGYLKIIATALLILTISCAKRGGVGGGLKDTLAPVLSSGFPKNYSKNVTPKEIKLNFDEYVKLKNVAKQLIVSPPMKYAPEISPYTASREIKIKILDTLIPNTTYSFSFGNSIEDNNEDNILRQFKYVFSTGNFIDSLKLKAKVIDAIDLKTPNFVSVMLYEVNEKYSDSAVYKEIPRYLTNTLDSLKTVELGNLKPGKYRLVAIKDENNNNKFDPKKDKIGFIKQYVTLPNDSLYELELFKQQAVFKVASISQASGNKIVIGYEGKPTNPAIEITKNKVKLPYVVTKYTDKDSLQVWYKEAKTDSIKIKFTNNSYSKTVDLKLRNQKKDTLSLAPKYTTVLPLRDDFILKSATPLVLFENSKMVLLNKDSVAVKFKTEYDAYNQDLKFLFKREPLEKYKLKLFPGSVTDFFNKQNDTIVFNFATRNTSDYGNLRVKLENVRQFPVLIELTNESGKVLYSATSEKETEIYFDLIAPEKVTLRVIYDENKNGIWDSGDFLTLKQAEDVIYFPKPIDVRANWDIEQPFNLKQ